MNYKLIGWVIEQFYNPCYKNHAISIPSAHSFPSNKCFFESFVNPHTINHEYVSRWWERWNSMESATSCQKGRFMRFSVGLDSRCRVRSRGNFTFVLITSIYNLWSNYRNAAPPLPDEITHVLKFSDYERLHNCSIFRKSPIISITHEHVLC